jgi:membrane protein DedA with SNARE-associated domain
VGDAAPHDDADDEVDADASTAGRGAPSRRALGWVVVPLVGLVAASWIGDAIGPGLVPDPEQPGSGRPELLLALSPRLRWQVAVVNYVDPVVFFAIATLRLLAADPPFYLLGYWYGESALRWAERNSPTAGAILRDSERFYGKLAYPLVAIAPNNVFCLLAGSSRMRPAVFFALNIGGTLARLWLVVIFGEAFEDQIDGALEWIGRYRWWLVGLSSVVVFVMAGSQLRSGTGEVAQLRDLGRSVGGEGGAGEDAGAGDVAHGGTDGGPEATPGPTAGGDGPEPRR